MWLIGEYCTRTGKKPNNLLELLTRLQEQPHRIGKSHRVWPVWLGLVIYLNNQDDAIWPEQNGPMEMDEALQVARIIHDRHWRPKIPEAKDLTLGKLPEACPVKTAFEKLQEGFGYCTWCGRKFPLPAGQEEKHCPECLKRTPKEGGADEQKEAGFMYLCEACGTESTITIPHAVERVLLAIKCPDCDSIRQDIVNPWYSDGVGDGVEAEPFEKMRDRMETTDEQLGERLGVKPPVTVVQGELPTARDPGRGVVCPNCRVAGKLHAKIDVKTDDALLQCRACGAIVARWIPSDMPEEVLDGDYRDILARFGTSAEPGPAQRQAPHGRIIDVTKEPPPSIPMWKSSRGELPIANMDDDHLLNAYRLTVRKAEQGDPNEEAERDLKAEIDRRGLEVQAQPDFLILSDSRIGMAIKCGEQERFRYGQGLKIPPSASTAIGRGVDRGVSLDLRRVVEFGERAPIEEVLDTARDELEDIWSGEIWLRGKEKQIPEDKIKSRSVDVMVRSNENHYHRVAPHIEPIAVQQKRTIQVPGANWKIIMYPDVEEADGIRDTKTGGTAWDQSGADGSLQLSLYGLWKMVKERQLPQLAIDMLYYRWKSGETKVYSLQTHRTKDDFKNALTIAEHAAQGITAGNLLPARFMPKAWWCLSMDTEILTMCGWRGYEEISRDGLVVMTLNPLSWLLEYQKPTLVGVKEHADRMVAYRGKALDFCVTPDHDMLVRSQGRSAWRWMKAADIEGKGSIGLPVSAYKPRSGLMGLGTVATYQEDSDAWIQLSGWLCAEGHFRKDSAGVEIYQKAGTAGHRQINGLLQQLGLDFSVYPNTKADKFYIKASGGEHVRDILQTSKGIPGWIEQADPRQFRLWLEALGAGDGHRSGRALTIAQKNESFIDKLQALCVTHRMSAVKGRGHRAHTLTILDGITERFIETSAAAKHYEKDHQETMVWCVTVPNGTLVTRRNGRVLITGNCSEGWCGYWDRCKYGARLGRKED
jgi:transcription elongation factor Elf1